MKKMILGTVWQLMGFIGAIIIVCSAAPHKWDYNGITGILGSLLGLDLMLWNIFANNFDQLQFTELNTTTEYRKTDR